MIRSATRQTRCAVYCRKSSDDGLEQAFNSLDAQRDSAESYIRSRVSQGWVCLPEKFEDGGFSGGTTERPALKRLLAAVSAGELDTVVVYRLDRFTRSLKDFGKLMDILNAANVAIVSVTESLDSSSASGRLMLNLLLSFAQYERELASDRTRDKIAASRKRGLWTGGRPILGYDLKDCTLIVNEAEANVVRAIFVRYLEVRSLSKLADDLRASGITTKRWTSKKQVVMGGVPFAKSTLHQLLSNPLYTGKVPHKGTLHAGAHDAIVAPEVFARVQHVLSENGRGGASLVRNTYGGLLKGVLVCGVCGAPMIHSSTKTERNVVHRYYTCRSRRPQSAQKCAGGSAPAEQLEAFVLAKARTAVNVPALVNATVDVCRARAEDQIRDIEARLVLAAAELVSARTNAARGDDTSGAAKLKAAVLAVGRLEGEIAAARTAIPARALVAAAIEEFDGIWSSLSPTERSHLIGTIVERVVFDPVKGELKLRFNERLVTPSVGEEGVR